MNDSISPKKGFLDRRITLRWALILLALVVVAALVLWVSQAMALRSLKASSQADLAAAQREVADQVAGAIATFGNRQIVQGNWEELQQYADQAVTRGGLAYVAIVNTDGMAEVHTDRAFQGKPFAEPVEGGGVNHASVPVMNLTSRVGTVWVGVSNR